MTWQARSLRLWSQGTVVMGFIEKAAGILTPGGVSNHSRPQPQAKAAKAPAGLAEARRY